MSLSLDIALFLREQKLEKKLSLAERGLLLTLAFRVGSNPFTWVSQESLSIETDTSISCIRELMKKIQEKGLIQVTRDSRDKRKLLYRPAEFLINYHQERTRIATKNYRRKTGGIILDTAGKPAVNTAGKPAVLLEKENAQTHATSTFANDENSPKAKGESNIKSKESRKQPSLFEPDEQNQTLCKENRIDLKTELEKFRAIYTGKKNQQNFKTWIYRAIEFNAKHKKPEIRSTIKEMPIEPEVDCTKGEGYKKFKEEMKAKGLLKARSK